MLIGKPTEAERAEMSRRVKEGVDEVKRLRTARDVAGIKAGKATLKIVRVPSGASHVDWDIDDSRLNKSGRRRCPRRIDSW